VTLIIELKNTAAKYLSQKTKRRRYALKERCLGQPSIWTMTAGNAAIPWQRHRGVPCR